VIFVRTTVAQRIDDPVTGGAPPGSLRYFAVLFSPPEVRPALNALYALEAELRSAVTSQNHEAAHARLQWWKGELDACFAGHAQHPITRALLGLRDRLQPADCALLTDLLIAAELDLAGMSYQKAEEFEAYCFRASGSLQTVICALLARDHRPSGSERRFAHRLGSALRQTEMLRDLQNERQGDRPCLPPAISESAAVDPRGCEDAASPAGPEVATGNWREQITREFAMLPNLLDADERIAQRHGLVLAALHARLLPRIEVSAGRAGTTARVPPFALLWTAWRTAIRYS
jgi:15-cis-phytoene synthase